MAPRAGADQRTYKADFAKFKRTFPAFEFRWTARKGADELYAAFKGIALSHAEFTDKRFTRLSWLRHLLDSGKVDGDLKMVRGPRRGPSRAELSVHRIGGRAVKTLAKDGFKSPRRSMTIEPNAVAATMHRPASSSHAHAAAGELRGRRHRPARILLDVRTARLERGGRQICLCDREAA